MSFQSSILSMLGSLADLTQRSHLIKAVNNISSTADSPRAEARPAQQTDNTEYNKAPEQDTLKTQQQHTKDAESSLQAAQAEKREKRGTAVDYSNVYLGRQKLDPAIAEQILNKQGEEK